MKQEIVSSKLIKMVNRKHTRKLLAKKIDENARNNVLTGAEKLVQDFEERYGNLMDLFERSKRT